VRLQWPAVAGVQLQRPGGDCSDPMAGGGGGGCSDLEARLQRPGESGGVQEEAAARSGGGGGIQKEVAARPGGGSGVQEEAAARVSGSEKRIGSDYHARGSSLSQSNHKTQVIWKG
jgi:hypothetical protein